MFMCRSLEEFRAAYIRLLNEPQPQQPDDVGPFKQEVNSDGEDDDDDNDEDDHQPQRFRLVVKREAYWCLWALFRFEFCSLKLFIKEEEVIIDLC